MREWFYHNLSNLFNRIGMFFLQKSIKYVYKKPVNWSKEGQKRAYVKMQAAQKKMKNRPPETKEGSLCVQCPDLNPTAEKI